MNAKYGADTLLILPCCAKKAEGGLPHQGGVDPLRADVSALAYSEILLKRAAVLKALQSYGEGTDGYDPKNRLIATGPDLGGESGGGLYSSAMARYTGKLYSVEGLKPAAAGIISLPNAPRIMILSALYGPLHPLSLIQDYNLEMKNACAKGEWLQAFPPFLENYVRQNQIKQVVLYLGSGSAYFPIVKRAVKYVRAKGLALRCVQYHVKDGGTAITPPEHGRRFLDDLDSRESEGFSRATKIEERPI